jgi:hypothetical protein
MNFPADSTLLNFFFLGCCHVVIRNPQLLYLVTAKYRCQMLSLSLCAPL